MPARPHQVMVILGTRPEAIKVAPVVRLLSQCPDFETTVVSTGQHREMLEQMWDVLDIRPDHELAVMRDRQSLSSLTGRLVDGLGELIRAERPEVVLVQGDTTTAMCGALAAFYEQISVGHIEAGLRSGRLDNPFPEELNRKLVSSMARWHFAPTALAQSNLLAEGVKPESIEVTGNTVIDNLLWVLAQKRVPSAFTSSRRRILVTLHRRESQGEVMADLARALAELANRGDLEVVLPLHMSPTVREALLPALGNHDAVHLVEPLDYVAFTSTMADADLILTDSGGVQEEAPTLGKPVLVLRETTERPEAVEAGNSRLVGTTAHRVLEETTRLLDDDEAYASMATSTNPFGDGHAALRILARLRADLAAVG
jgi:UDP-N-acetylglucosamine 2-epimerase (non-hydrolysing)